MDFILDAVAEKVIVYSSSLDYGITSELIEKKIPSEMEVAPRYNC